MELDLNLLNSYAEDAIQTKRRTLTFLLVLVTYIRLIGLPEVLNVEWCNTLILYGALLIFMKVSVDYTGILLDMNYMDFVEIPVKKIINASHEAYDELITTDEHSYFFEQDNSEPIPENPKNLMMVVTRRSRLPVMLNILER